MHKIFLSSLRQKLKGYKHTSDIISFVRRARRRADVAALILFGSLAQQDFYEHSDADVCLVLRQPTVDPLYRDVDSFWLEAPAGIIELHIYGSEQFKHMIRRADGLALEVMHWGLVLCDNESYLAEIENVFEETRRELGIVQVRHGWLVGQREN